MNKNVVSVRTTVFDDWEFDADENPISPGGRDVVEWLAGRLGEHSPIEAYVDYGWCFELTDRAPRIWCMIAMGPGEREYYFWAEPILPIWKIFFGQGGRADEATLSRIEGFLAADKRFEDVRIVPAGN